jgi:plastocyanin
MKALFLAVAGLVAVVGCGGSGSSTAAPSSVSAATPAPSAPAAAAIEVTLRDFKIEPATFSTGPNATIAVTSDGPTPHNFTVRDAAGTNVAASKDLRTGESDTVVLAALAAGEYTFFCSFAGHESLGMRGTLTVTP